MKSCKLKMDAFGHRAGRNLIWSEPYRGWILTSDGCPTIVLHKDEIEIAIKLGWIEEVPERVKLVIFNSQDRMNVRKTDLSPFDFDELSKMEAALNGELFDFEELLNFALTYEDRQARMPKNTRLMISTIFEEWNNKRKP